MKFPTLLKVFGCIVLCEAVGGVGSLFTAPNLAWYGTLQKPVFTPPSWVFGPVWTLLFALMGVSLFLLWREKEAGKERMIALQLFALQLLLNVIWSYVFFARHNLAIAFGEIVLLWIAILLTIVFAHACRRVAGWLLVPYLLWVSFAGVLNFALWQENKVVASMPVACTAEAKLCPDGSSVGRTGPDCTFAPCP